MGHDRLRFKAEFPTGASLSWNISRSGETISVAFSNDDATLRRQIGTVGLYVAKLIGSYAEKYDQLEALLAGCKGGDEVIAKMEAAIHPIG